MTTYPAAPGMVGHWALDGFKWVFIPIGEKVNCSMPERCAICKAKA